MVAALISKIIGMLYKSPLSTTLGSQSFALFQFAQNVYFILLMIASFSIPQAVSKIMAEKIALRCIPWIFPGIPQYDAYIDLADH